MTTSCERIEALLPAFVEGDLAPGEAAAVSAHVESCAACAESLAAFTVLEQSLVSRRTEVPSPAAYLPAVAPVSAPAHSRLIGAFRGLMSLPGVSIMLTMWATLLALSFSPKIAGGVSRYSSLERWQALADGAVKLLTRGLGDNVWVMIAAYAMLTIVILGSMGSIAYRFVRR
jgi:anti-sigma factor RsiW